MPEQPPKPSPSASTDLIPVGWSRDLQFERAALLIIQAKASKNTIRAYQADLERWLRFCYATGVAPANPGLEAATLFREHLMSTVSTSSARRIVSALSFVYRTLLRSQPPLVRGNPFHPAVLAWPPGSKVGKTPAVPDEVAQAMIAHAAADPDPQRGARDQAILRMLYDTGLRRASVAQLKRASLRGNICLAIVKGNKEQEVELPAQTLEVVQRWLTLAPLSVFIFPGESGGMIGLTTINKIVAERAEAVGAEGVHPHCFRAAFITAGYDAGLPEHEIQASAHHSDPQTTRLYDRGQRGHGVTDAVAKFRTEKEKK